MMKLLNLCGAIGISFGERCRSRSGSKKKMKRLVNGKAPSGKCSKNPNAMIGASKAIQSDCVVSCAPNNTMCHCLTLFFYFFDDHMSYLLPLSLQAFSWRSHGDSLI